MNITFFDYLASKKPYETFEAMSNYVGRPLKRPRRQQQLSAMLQRFVKDYGEPALNELAKIHPDKDLIEGLANVEKVKPESSFGENNVDEFQTPKSDCKCGGKCKGNCPDDCGCKKNNNQNFSNFCAGCGGGFAFDGSGKKYRLVGDDMNFSYMDATMQPAPVTENRLPETLFAMALLGFAVALIIREK